MKRVAIVLAAGGGTRMKSDLPKPLHEICGAPMVEHVLRAVAPSCDRACVVADEGARDAMARALRGAGGRVEFAIQGAGGYGTGYAAMCASEFAARGDAALVTAGDIPLLRPETIGRLYEAVEGGADAAMLTVRVPDPTGYGRIARDPATGDVIGIVEQKDCDEGQRRIDEVNVSVFCFRVESLLWALPKLTAENAAGEYYLTDVVALFARSGRRIVAILSEDAAEGMGVNDRAQLAAAAREMRRRINAAHMRAGVTLIDPETAYIDVDAEIGRDAVIRPCVAVGRGARIAEGEAVGPFESRRAAREGGEIV